MKIDFFYYSLKNGAGTEKVLVTTMNYFYENFKDKHVRFLGVSNDDSSFFDLNSRIIKSSLCVEIGNRYKIGVINKLAYYKSIILRLKSYVKNPPDVFICGHPLLAMCVYVASLSLAREIEIISCEHFAFSKSSAVSRFLKTILYKKMTVVTLTEHDRSIIRKFAPRVFCIPNSLTSIPSVVSSLDNKVMLSIGRLHKQKGYDLLFETIFAIKNELDGWKIHIVGDDCGEKPHLCRLIAKFGLHDIVKIYDKTTTPEKHYLSSSIYLMSSRFEGFPMVLLEALSYGLPVISFDCPTGPKELIIHETNGYLVPAFDKEEFSKKILELISSKRRRDKLGQAALETANDFTQEKQMYKWIKVLERVRCVA